MDRLSRALIITASAAHMLAYLYAQSEHVVDDSWPSHARFHVLQALVWIEALDLAVIVMALRPAARWRTWGIGLCGGLAHGAYFLSLGAMPQGAPVEGMGAHLPLAAIALVFAAGWAVAARRGPSQPQPPRVGPAHRDR